MIYFLSLKFLLYCSIFVALKFYSLLAHALNRWILEDFTNTMFCLQFTTISLCSEGTRLGSPKQKNLNYQQNGK